MFLAFVVLFTLYKAVKVHEFKSKFWNVLTIVLMVLSLISPVKYDGTNSDQFKSNEVRSVESTKVLPPKVVDKSFTEQVKSVKSISEKDLK